MTGSAEDARQKLITQRDAIINNAVANGQNKEAVERYIDSILKIPAKVPPTKVDVDKAEAELKLQGFQTAINNLTGKTVHIYSIEHIQQVRDGGDTATANAMNTANQYATGNAYRAAGGMIYRAAGGLVNYLAGGGFPQFKPVGTDTVPAMLTPGEIVIKKSSVESIGAGKLLHANETGRLPEGGNTFIINDTSGNPVSTAYTTARVLAARAV
jgi:hypothetical protein